ncbi:MAG: hypothetical protein IT449_09305 [Phycisphaerales bacterium]|nr:hypothetical protein [Phycisphaerales bacterium]
MNAIARLSVAMAASLAPACGAGAHASATPAADAGSVAAMQDEVRSAATEALAIRDLPGRFLVLHDHDGSPWTLGRTVDVVVKYRASLSGAGSLFIRHDHTFPVVPDARPKFAVGFLVNERIDVASSFRIEAQPACEVASWVTDGPAWKTGALVSRMTLELNARGLEPAGPFMEFLEAPAGAASTDAQRSRLEVAVRARESREADAKRVASAAAEDPDPAESASLHDTSSHAAPPHSRAARDQVLAFMDSIAASRNPVQWPLMLWESENPAQSESVDQSADTARSEETAQSASKAAVAVDGSPAARLFLDRRYDELAELLFPKRRKLSRDQREWLARVFAGLHELEVSAREADSAFADEMQKLHEALHRRAESVRIELPELKDAGPRGQRRSVAGTDAPSVVLAALHGWSADLAGGGAELTARRERMAEILGRIERVLAEP